MRTSGAFARVAALDGRRATRPGECVCVCCRRVEGGGTRHGENVCVCVCHASSRRQEHPADGRGLGASPQGPATAPSSGCFEFTGMKHHTPQDPFPHPSWFRHLSLADRPNARGERQQNHDEEGPGAPPPSSETEENRFRQRGITRSREPNTPPLFSKRLPNFSPNRSSPLGNSSTSQAFCWPFWPPFLLMLSMKPPCKEHRRAGWPHLPHHWHSPLKPPLPLFFSPPLVPPSLSSFVIPSRIPDTLALSFVHRDCIWEIPAPFSSYRSSSPWLDGASSHPM